MKTPEKMPCLYEPRKPVYQRALTNYPIFWIMIFSLHPGCPLELYNALRTITAQLWWTLFTTKFDFSVELIHQYTNKVAHDPIRTSLLFEDWPAFTKAFGSKWGHLLWKWPTTGVYNVLSATIFSLLQAQSWRKALKHKLWFPRFYQYLHYNLSSRVIWEADCI